LQTNTFAQSGPGYQGQQTNNAGVKESTDGPVFPGSLLADDGVTRIQAFENKGKNRHFDYDCHGFTFAKSKFWIDSKEVPKILKGDNYSPVYGPLPDKGDIVVYSNDNGVVHSAIVTDVNYSTGDVMVQGKGGITPSPVTTPVEPGPGGGWNDPNAKYEYYRKFPRFCKSK
jgi:hypothetical protein